MITMNVYGSDGSGKVMRSCCARSTRRTFSIEIAAMVSRFSNGYVTRD